MRDPIEQLRRIQNALVKIADYVNKGRRTFNEEEEIRLSIIYYLQTISEAARAISQEYRTHHSEIPWKLLIDFQNFITYYYLKHRPSCYKIQSGCSANNIDEER